MSAWAYIFWSLVALCVLVGLVLWTDHQHAKHRRERQDRLLEYIRWLGALTNTVLPRQRGDSGNLLAASAVGLALSLTLAAGVLWLAEHLLAVLS